MPRRRQDQLDDLTFSIERWLPNDQSVEQVFAHRAKVTHAYILFDRVQREYPCRILRIEQRVKIIQEQLPDSAS